MRKILLGVDIGSSGCKCVAVDERMRIVTVDRRVYSEPLHSPAPGWYEQDPRGWWQAAKTCIRAVTASLDGGDEVAAIGVTGQMHGLVALDEQGEVLRECIHCTDFRNEEQRAEITARAGGLEGLLRLVNNRMWPSCTGGKLLWMKQHETALFERIRTIVNPKDYVRYRLTGEWGTDASDASGTGLYDPESGRWSAELLERLELPAAILPKVYQSTEVAGRLLPELAGELGLPAGLPVAAGGGDAVVQTLGAGVSGGGEYCVILGSGMVVSCTLDEPVRNATGLLQLYAAAVPGKITAYSGLMAGGGALEWLRDAFFAPECEVAAQTGRGALALMDEEAAQVPPGAEGLLFYPNLLGQRTPHEDAMTRGALMGLTPRHEKRHVVRALLEGLQLGLCDVAGLFEPLAGPVRCIQLTGGGAASALWCQIQADVFGAEVRRMSGFAHGGAQGAALLAGVAAGVYAGAEQGAELLECERVFTPNAANAACYRTLLAAYREIYPANQSLFHTLSEM